MSSPPVKQPGLRPGAWDPQKLFLSQGKKEGVLKQTTGTQWGQAGGGPVAGRAGSEQSADTLPSASRHLSVLSQSCSVCLGEEPGWPGQVHQRPRQAGGPFRAGRMSGGREADRQCHPEVTSGLAWGHQEPEPPHMVPPLSWPP